VYSGCLADVEALTGFLQDGIAFCESERFGLSAEMAK
jgi:hypothetical protein